MNPIAARIETALDFRSYRRRLLDEALHRVAATFDGTVLDVGGGRDRGGFSTPGDPMISVDIVGEFGPTVQADAASLPFRSNCIDAIRCTELLEHVVEPQAIVDEFARVLKPGGALVLSMPFNYRIHGDPYDFQRYTDQKLRRVLEADFTIESLESQGAFFTVLAHMLQRAIINLKTPSKRLLYPLLPVLDAVARVDDWSRVQRSAYCQSYTTGYFVLARRRGDTG